MARALAALLLALRRSKRHPSSWDCSLLERGCFCTSLLGRAVLHTLQCLGLNPFTIPIVPDKWSIIRASTSLTKPSEPLIHLNGQGDPKLPTPNLQKCLASMHWPTSVEPIFGRRPVPGSMPRQCQIHNSAIQTDLDVLRQGTLAKDSQLQDM